MASAVGSILSLGTGILNAIPKIIATASQATDLISQIRGDSNPIDYLDTDRVAHVNEVVTLAQRTMGVAAEAVLVPSVPTNADGVTSWIKSIAPILNDFSEWIDVNVTTPHTHLRLAGGVPADTNQRHFSDQITELDTQKIALMAETDVAVSLNAITLGKALTSIRRNFPMRNIQTLDEESRSSLSTPRNVETQRLRGYYSNIISQAFYAMAPSKSIAPFNAAVPFLNPIWEWNREDESLSTAFFPRATLDPPNGGYVGVVCVTHISNTMSTSGVPYYDFAIAYRPFTLPTVGDPSLLTYVHSGVNTSYLGVLDGNYINGSGTVQSGGIALPPKNSIYTWYHRVRVRLHFNQTVFPGVLNDQAWITFTWIGPADPTNTASTTPVLHSKTIKHVVRQLAYEVVSYETMFELPMDSKWFFTMTMSTTAGTAFTASSRFSVTIDCDPPRAYLKAGSTIPYTAVTYKQVINSVTQPYASLPDPVARYSDYFGTLIVSPGDDPIASVPAMWLENVGVWGNVVNDMLLQVQAYCDVQDPPINIHAKYRTVTGNNTLNIADFVPVQQWPLTISSFSGLSAANKRKIIRYLLLDLEAYAIALEQTANIGRFFDDAVKVTTNA